MFDIFNQHPLPEGELEAVKYIKRMWIIAQIGKAAQPGDLITAMKFHIVGFEATDQSDAGTPLNGGTPETLLQPFLAAPDPTTIPGAPFTPLDFSIAEPCMIALRLVGDFWAFSNRYEQVTTKVPHSDNRYYRLRRHQVGTNASAVPGLGSLCRCVSFYARQPWHADYGERHGFSFNVDILPSDDDTDKRRLPITVDPDIENKGGNG